MDEAVAAVVVMKFVAGVSSPGARPAGVPLAAPLERRWASFARRSAWSVSVVMVQSSQFQVPLSSSTGSGHPGGIGGIGVLAGQYDGIWAPAGTAEAASGAAPEVALANPAELFGAGAGAGANAVGTAASRTKLAAPPKMAELVAPTAVPGVFDDSTTTTSSTVAICFTIAGVASTSAGAVVKPRTFRPPTAAMANAALAAVTAPATAAASAVRRSIC